MSPEDTRPPAAPEPTPPLGLVDWLHTVKPRVLAGVLALAWGLMMLVVGDAGWWMLPIVVGAAVGLWSELSDDGPFLEMVDAEGRPLRVRSDQRAIRPAFRVVAGIIGLAFLLAGMAGSFSGDWGAAVVGLPFGVLGLVLAMTGGGYLWTEVPRDDRVGPAGSTAGLAAGDPPGGFQDIPVSSREPTPVPRDR